MMERTVEAVDYDKYRFSPKELVLHIALGSIMTLALGVIFFKSLIVTLLLTPMIYLYIKGRKKAVISIRKKRLVNQFKEGMYALTSALSSGRSVEQAFITSLHDLKLIYTDEDDIVREWQLICHKLAMNETIESTLIDLSNRANIEDIDSFCSVFVMAKRSGGNLIHILKQTSDIISEKMDIRNEIDVLVTQKQFEQKLLSIIIPAMILLLDMMAPDFLKPLYTTMTGRIIMIIALLMYIVSTEIGKRIVDIEV